MEKDKAIKSKYYIQDLIEEGEHEQQDFKYQISDARKIARSISAFANHRGGHLLIGVKDNGRIAGVKSDEEIYMIEQAAEMYCQPAQQVMCDVYRVEGKNVVKVEIEEAASKPVKAQDEEHRWKAYYRVADENILASALHVKVWQHIKEEDAMISFTENENVLIDYVKENGNITLTEYTRLAHISRKAAERIVVNMCSMNALTIEYADGKCVIAEGEGIEEL